MEIATYSHVQELVRQLPATKRLIAYRFLLDLVDKKEETLLPQKIMPTTSPKKRTVGEYVGKIHISDDFDAPLPDEFWLGKSDK
jgi:hypothetical protein